MLQHTGIFSLTVDQFGIFIGASIHVNSAKVVVAGNNVGQDASDIVVIVKITRVLFLLVPVLILLSVYEQKRTTNKTYITKSKIINLGLL
ncbi:MAG: putative sulfate exporter family transporter [Rickettsiales endosymbiont of Dermacentor nuttalli]